MNSECKSYFECTDRQVAESWIELRDTWAADINWHTGQSGHDWSQQQVAITHLSSSDSVLGHLLVDTLIHGYLLIRNYKYRKMWQLIKSWLKTIFFKLYLNVIGAVYLVKENVIRPRRLPNYDKQGESFTLNLYKAWQ